MLSAQMAPLPTSVWIVIRTMEDLEGKVLHLFPCSAWRRREFSSAECISKNVILLEVGSLTGTNSKLKQSFHLLKLFLLFLKKLIVHLYAGMKTMLLSILVVSFPSRSTQIQ